MCEQDVFLSDLRVNVATFRFAPFPTVYIQIIVLPSTNFSSFVLMVAFKKCLVRLFICVVRMICPSLGL